MGRSRASLRRERQMSAFGAQRDSVEQIRAQRELIRPLLVPDDPADAMTAYYALSHDPRRVRLTLHRTPTGRVDGFLAVCQTGRDLFVPVLVMRASEHDVDDLLYGALVPSRPHTLVTLPALSESVQAAVIVDKQQVNRIYELDVSSFRPVINVMVQPGQSAFRYEIHTQGRVVAAAGVNWRSAHLADMYVYTEQGFKGRGWGKAVGAACVRDLLAARIRPLYTVSEDNLASLRLAESLGFQDSGAREFECLVRLGQS